MELTGNVSGLINLGGGGGGSTVEVTPILTSGEHIANIEVDGVTSELYAPEPTEPTEVEVNPIVTSGDHIADIEVNGVTSELYAPSTLDIYSENEIEIGTFLNGTLYRRVIVLNSPLTLNSGQWLTTSIDISFLRYIIRKEFISSEDGANTGGGSIVFKNNSGYMEIGNEQKNDIMKFDMIVLEYTK